MAGTALVSRRSSRDTRRSLVLALFVLTSASGCLPPAGRSLAVWAVNGQERLAADSPPVLESKLFSAARREIFLTAAINETVAFQIALRTDTPPAGPYRLEISDLVGPGGKLSAESAVSLYRIQPVRVERFGSWYPAHVGRPAAPISVPDILVPWKAPRGGGPLVLGGAGNELVWVDLRVPPTVSPGMYTGRLTVREVTERKWRGLTGARQTAPAFACDLRVQVLPVALPGARSLPVICRVDPRDLLAAHLRWPRESAEQTRLLPEAPQHQAALNLVGATMRLFHDHRTTPILWASFPRFRPAGRRGVAVDWKAYDQLVDSWLSGDAFADLVGLSHWPIPVSLDHPSARREGGLASPRYARLLAAYLAECRRHFAERGWLDRAFVRFAPPEPLTTAAVERIRRVAGILRQSEAEVPLVAHLPARSLRGLGWRNAPIIDLPSVSVWAPPARWYEPEALRREQALGRSAWLMPDHPPYSGTLAPEGLPTDAPALPWLAYRYEIDGLWIERAADLGAVAETRPGRAGAPECLIYAGRPYGLHDRPIPSIRLKRLRRGLQDHALLSLLERRGQKLLARALARQVVRWACTDACLDHLLDGKPTGWTYDARTLSLARELILQELVDEFAPAAGARRSQVARLAEWGRLMNQATRVRAAVEGVRLSAAGQELRAHVFCSALNCTNRTLTGRWTLPAPPIGWSQPAEPTTTLPANTHRLTRLELSLTGLAYNTNGVYPFDLHFDTTGLGAFAVPARLAVAVCPDLKRSPTVDGDLSDWALGSNNAAGDFQLVRGRQSRLNPAQTNRPTRPTQAFFGRDRERLYVAVRCWLGEDEQPLWRADNRVPLDGAVPWGQDVAEILIDPRPTLHGTSSDIFVLQIKPNGVLVALRGCPTDPPMGTSEVWQSGAALAVAVLPEAWVIELSLPLAALGPAARENRMWGFNITRLDARRGEYSSWSGARGNCYSPKSLGNLILLRP